MAKVARLGVNIDHVATVRQARGENYPSVSRAAELALQAGADQITIHLREDRRHIQDADIKAVSDVTKNFKRLFNFEMGVSEEILNLAIKAKPDWVCLVPEKREERTTEGGLDLIHKDNFEKIKRACEQLKEKTNTKISLFVEADISILDRVRELPVDAVEIHTGDYAQHYLKNKDTQEFLKKFQRGQDLIKSLNLGYHAGHGLTLKSVAPLLEKGLFEEYNIGHWIIAEAIFEGLAQVVKKFTHEFRNYPLQEKRIV
jgi:pyridoxine 5-phosphate synthase